MEPSATALSSQDGLRGPQKTSKSRSKNLKVRRLGDGISGAPFLLRKDIECLIFGGESVPNYRFDRFEVDPQRRLLLRDGYPVPLTEKPFQVLLVLLSRVDQVVSRERLLDAVWSDCHVTEANLTQSISVLRKALGETPESRRFIVTVPRQGYRFVASLEKEGEPEERRSPRWRWAAIFAVALVLAALVPWQWSGDANPDREAASTLCQRAQMLARNRTPDGIRQAVPLFHQALTLDPDYEPALIGISDVYLFHGYYRLARIPPRRAYSRAAWAAQRVLDRNPDSFEAITNLAFIAWMNDRDPARAEPLFRRAEGLCPDCPKTIHWFALFLITHGRVDEAQERLERAVRNDPLRASAVAALADLDLARGDLPAARRMLEQALETDPLFPWAHLKLGMLLLHNDAPVEGLQHLQRARDLLGDDFPTVLGTLGVAHAILGQEDRAREILERLQRRVEQEALPAAIDLALIHDALGETEPARRWFDRALENREIYPQTLHGLLGDGPLAQISILRDSPEAVLDSPPGS
jgi:DNA-binding winged helix-turn-helix (wHTH) protein/Tfp pilus assembly protein PilF